MLKLCVDPALEALEVLLSETVKESKDSKISEKLAKAQELVKTVKVRSSGILTRFSLDGQVALVTGGGQGIGRSCKIYNLI